MVTLADVAALAKVSKATASRAFSRPQAVTPATAERVMWAADTLGFVPNIAARQLARGKVGILGLVVPTLSNQFFTPIIAGAQEYAQQHGWQLTVVVHHFDSVARVHAFERLSRQADGFILAAPRGSDDHIQAVGEYKPAVLIDREVPGIDAVVADTARAFGELADRLFSAGHRRVAYLGGPEGSWQDPRRQHAVEEAARKARGEVVVLGPYPSTLAAGIHAADAVRRAEVTAVIPYATALGMGVSHRLMADGTVPLPTVTTETAIAAALGVTELPTIDVDGHGLGRASATRLLARINAPRGETSVEYVAVPVGP